MENEELKVLFHACTLGRADIAKSALGTIRSNMAQSDSDFIEIISKQRVEDGLTPLHVASLCGSADVIRSLLVRLICLVFNVLLDRVTITKIVDCKSCSIKTCTNWGTQRKATI